MAKENIKKFFDLVNRSEDLQNELKKRDSDYAETHDAPAEGASEEEVVEARKTAFENIVIPVAKEQGLDFTVDEMIEFEKEKIEEMDRELDNKELQDAAGGGVNEGVMACFVIGIGFGQADVVFHQAHRGSCIIIGMGFALHWEGFDD